MASTTWPQVASNVPLIFATNPTRQEETQADVSGFLPAGFLICSLPTGGAADIKLLDVRIVSADEHSARKLEIAEGDPTIYIRH